MLMTASATRLRLALFWLLTGLLTLAYALLLPAIVLPRPMVLAIVRSYLAAVLFLLRRVIGLRWEIRGDAAAARRPVLVAAKHQSAFETIILQHVLADPAIILKRELLRVPLWGWVMRRLGHIGADRSGGLESARLLLAAARHSNGAGRPVLIFPEGSRRSAGAEPDYKPGVELLYGALGAPCVPVAVNSGRVWPARSLSPRPGRIVVEFLPPIPPGLTRAAFRKQLAEDIERATSRLMQSPD
jgi:1-acyl-sn-glycerol-3-phosphate acyltransferase